MAKKAIDFSTPTGPTPKKSKLDRESETPTPSTPLSPSHCVTPDPKATVCGIVHSLSPHPSPHNYFHGELTDGETVLSLLGYDDELQMKLKDHMDSKQTITLRNCQVSKNIKTDKLQVVVKSYTLIEKASPDIQYTIQDPSTLGSPMISLDTLPNFNQYDRVTCRAKIIQIKESQSVSTGKLKQEIIIADSTARAALTLWEDDVDSLKTNYTYRFNRLSVNKYAGRTELTLPQYGSTIEPIDNDNLMEDILVPEELNKTSKELNGVTITAVNQLQYLVRCTHCKKQSGTTNSKLFHCSYCDTSQKVKTNTITAKLYVEDASGISHSLRAYSDSLSDIVVADVISIENLLDSPPFSLTYNDFNVITSITRD